MPAQNQQFRQSIIGRAIFGGPPPVPRGPRYGDAYGYKGPPGPAPAYSSPSHSPLQFAHGEPVQGNYDLMHGSVSTGRVGNQGPAMPQNKLFPRPKTVGGMQFDSQGRRILSQSPARTVLSMADYSPMLKDAGFAPPQGGYQRAQVPQRAMGDMTPEQQQFELFNRQPMPGRAVAPSAGVASSRISGPGIRKAFGPGHPLWGKSPEEMQAAVESQINLREEPPALDAANFVAPDGRRYAPQQAPPSMNEGRVGMGALPSDAQAAERVAYGMKMPNMTYSGSYADRLNPMDQNYRQGMISRTNRDAERLAATGTFQEAVAAGNNFNADGRFFQGARLGADAQGRPYFSEGDQQPNFAGGAKTAKETAAKRERFLKGLVQREVGQIDPATGAFMGFSPRDAQGNDTGIAGLGNQSMTKMRGRLGAGGTWNSELTQDQLNANKLNMLVREAGRKERSRTRIQALAQEKTAARRARLNPTPVQNLLRNNPALAAQFQAMQMQQEHALALQEMENQGRVDAAQRAADADMFRAQVGGMVGMGGIEGLTPEQRAGMLDAIAGMRPGAAQGRLLGQNQAPPQAPAQGRFQELLRPQGLDLNAKVHFGGKMSQNELDQLTKIAHSGVDRRVIVGHLGQYALDDAEATEALNMILGTRFATKEKPNFFGRVQNWWDWMAPGGGGESMPGPVVPGS